MLLQIPLLSTVDQPASAVLALNGGSIKVCMPEPDVCGHSKITIDKVLHIAIPPRSLKYLVRIVARSLIC
jgi:hypothetical protein